MSKLALAAVTLPLVAAILAVLDLSEAAAIAPSVLLTSRWIAIAALVAYAVPRRSLTVWILVSMVIGAEVGHDFPAVAVALRVLSQVFLRLIRTIVAPLLFATLVVGIAGHSNLRQVGRMGVKALVYFEVVTTIALFIGWAAISISRAGEGINLPPPADATQLQQPGERTWQDIVLDIFPENIARAVARRRRGHRVHGGEPRPRNPREPVQAAGDVLCRGDGLHRGSPAAGCADGAGSDTPVHSSGGRAGVDCLRHHQLRGRAAARDGSHGEAGGAAADRRVRHADRL
jgi:hypothetical protein